jgi:hypothetical protein
MEMPSNSLLRNTQQELLRYYGNLICHNTIYEVHFAGNHLITVQDLDDTKYLTKTLTEEYKKMGTRN